MATFSFVTSDLKESIANGSDGEWWLVTPSSNTKVVHYEGAGIFINPDGERINVLGWLARQNYPDIEFDDAIACNIGANLRLGSYLLDKDLNKYGCKMHLNELVGVDDQLNAFLFEDYEHPFEVNGVVASANEHIQNGRLKEKKLTSTVKLKIASQESMAVYENLEEALDCPYQGCFF